MGSTHSTGEINYLPYSSLTIFKYLSCWNLRNLVASMRSWSAYFNSSMHPSRGVVTLTSSSSTGTGSWYSIIGGSTMGSSSSNLGLTYSGNRGILTTSSRNLVRSSSYCVLRGDFLVCWLPITGFLPLSTPLVWPIRAGALAITLGIPALANLRNTSPSGSSTFMKQLNSVGLLESSQIITLGINFQNLLACMHYVKGNLFAL